MADAPKKAAPLYTPAFWTLCLTSLFCFCNLAIFYGFYNYLEGLGIPAAWRGPLLALEPVTALVLRPWLAVAVTLRNSLRGMYAGVIMTGVALLCYPFATEIWTIALVRALHGAGYVIQATALVVAFTHLLPESRAAEGFGILSLTTLLPGALMPPFVEVVTPLLPTPGWAYAMAAPLTIVILLLLIPLGSKMRAMAATLPPQHNRRPTLAELRADLRNPGVLLLLAAYLLTLTGHTIVFFFIKGWSLTLGAVNPGLFLAFSNIATIATRVVGMRLYDRLNSGLYTALALLFLAALVPCVGLVHSATLVNLLAVPYGIGLALCMPLFNAAMFRVSPPHLRGLNTNLLLVAMDAGFMIGPIIGGQALAAGLSQTGLFALCGALILPAGLLVLPVGRRTPPIVAKTAPRA